VAILPDAGQKRDMGISNYLKIANYLDCFIGGPRRENSPSYESVQYLGDLDV